MQERREAIFAALSFFYTSQMLVILRVIIKFAEIKKQQKDMKKLLGLALLMVVGMMIASCTDDADRRRVYVVNNTQDTLVLYLQDGKKYSEVHADFNTIFPPSKTVEMPFFVPFNGLPSYPFDEDHEKVMFKTLHGAKPVKKDYHNGSSFVYGKRDDVEGYFFVVETSDILN